MLSSGAVWAGGDEDCGNGQSACCINGDLCYCMTPLMCNIWGGVFHPGQHCSDIVCDYGCGGPCDEGETQDCYGNCFPAQWLGDGECENGWSQWDTNTIYLDCEEFGWDGGDCTPTGPVPTVHGACCIGDQTDCDERVCAVLEFWDCTLNDGVFLGENTSCLDATCGCPPGTVADCSGNCFPVHFLGDGTCHEGEYYTPPGDDPPFYLDLGCLELGCDSGDCIGVCSGACCFGMDCLTDLSVVGCIELGGVFLGSGSECAGIDCSDYLSPLVLSAEVDTPVGPDTGRMSGSVGAGGGSLAVAVEREQVEGQYYPAVYLYDEASNLVERIVAPAISEDRPLVDTDGRHVVMSVFDTILIYTITNGVALEATITHSENVRGVAVSDDRMVFHDLDTVMVYQRQGSSWVHEETIEAGIWIETIDIDGDVLAVVDLIRLVMYAPSGSTWVPEASWSVSGQSQEVGVSGSRVVLGEAGATYQGTTTSGQARVFARSGTHWTQEATLVPVNVSPDDKYAERVAIDGDVVAVTAVGNDELAFNSGITFMFERIDGTWAQIAKVAPDDPVSEMGYGHGVGISGRSVITSWRRSPDPFSVGYGAQIGLLPDAMWSNVDGGAFNDADNWAPFTPSTGTADISIPAKFEIEIAGNLGIQSLLVGPSRPRFTVGPATLGSEGQGLLSIAGTQAYTGDLSIAASLTVDGDIVVGSPRRPGTLAVESVGALSVTGDLTIAKLGQLDLQIDQGGSATSVDGILDFEGALLATFADDLPEPDVGTVFPILHFTSDSGSAFEIPVAILPGLGSGRFVSIEATAGLGSTVTLNLVVQSIEGLNDLGAPADTSVSGTATDIVVADLTSQAGGPDGFDDIALTVAGDPGYVMILVSDGAGGVVEQVAHTVGADPTSINAGDFDDDGFTDLVFAYQGADQMQTLMNGGGLASDMALGSTTSICDGPVDLAVMRLDGDDDDDVVLVCAGDGTVQGDGTFYGELEYYESNGGALRSTFTKTQGLTLSEMPGQVKPGSVGAGKGAQRTAVTLLTVNETVLFGDEDGLASTSFVEMQRIAVGAEPGSLVMGDLNGDDFDDLLVANSGSDTISVMLGVSAWVLGSEQVFTCGDSPSNLTLLDYDGDGDQDVAVRVLDSTGQPMVHVYRNDSGAASGGLTLALEQTIVDSIQLVDAGSLDGDATDDLVTVTDDMALRGPMMTLGVRMSDEQDAMPCQADLNGDGTVGIDDLLIVIGAWGAADGDVDGDGVTGIDDMLEVINQWGSCN